jgi:hypothetical protein
MSKTEPGATLVRTVEGRVSLGGVPPGTYTLVIEHGAIEWQQTIAVDAEGATLAIALEG